MACFMLSFIGRLLRPALAIAHWTKMLHRFLLLRQYQNTSSFSIFLLKLIPEKPPFDNKRVCAMGEKICAPPTSRPSQLAPLFDGYFSPGAVIEWWYTCFNTRDEKRYYTARLADGRLLYRFTECFDGPCPLWRKIICILKFPLLLFHFDSWWYFCVSFSALLRDDILFLLLRSSAF